VSQDYKENPSAFMRQEDRFDARGNEGMNRNNDVTRGELVNMDHFLDSHPEIAEQLRKDPSLVDNKKFVSSHPALQQFLADHPQVAQEYKENPNMFMHQEKRFDQREDRRNFASMDRFMDSHPEVAEQLKKDPSLVDNKKFVNSHPALQQFLADHPEVSQDFKESPSSFMRQENSFDRQQDGFDGHGNAGMHRDNDVTRGELSNFHEFMEGHGAIASELSKNPSLATNQEYLENHPALKSYLQSNPNVREELSENPQSFVKSAQQGATPAKGVPKATTMTDPKMK
jgi:hypothetical protein